MEDSWQLRRAAQVLRAGGVIAHATEAVIGLAARADDRAACARVARIKRRAATQQFIVICHSVAACAHIAQLDTPFAAAIDSSWPGPHTWILTPTPAAPSWLIGPRGGLAVRVTAHPQAAALARLCGPLISTSANPHGRPPARRLLRARHYFGASVDHYLPGALGASARPTGIRDGRTGEVLRA